MPRQVEITVKGLAFCFIKNGQWNVSFVCDAVHPLTLTPPSGGSVSLKRGMHDLTCEFQADLVTNTGPLEFPASGFPNYSAEYAHDVTSTANSNLDFTRRNNWNTGTLTLGLPEATMEIPPHSLTPHDCWIQEVKARGGGAKENLGKVATKVVFKFTIDSDQPDALRVLVTHRTSGDVYDERFPENAGGGPLAFEFDNGCGNRCTRNDSIDLYDIFKDNRGGPEKQFVTGMLNDAGEVPGSDPTNPSLGEEADPESMALFSAIYGNCDPVGGEPPPGP